MDHEKSAADAKALLVRLGSSLTGENRSGGRKVCEHEGVAERRREQGELATHLSLLLARDPAQLVTLVELVLPE